MTGNDVKQSPSLYGPAPALGDFAVATGKSNPICLFVAKKFMNLFDLVSVTVENTHFPFDAVSKRWTERTILSESSFVSCGVVAQAASCEAIANSASVRMIF